MSVVFAEDSIDTFTTFSRPTRYEFQKKIGSGTYGSVCEYFDTVDKKKVAIKRIACTERTYDLKKVYREFHLMKLCHHPSIIDLYEVYTASQTAHDMRSIYIVQELMEKTLLQLVINETSNLPLDQISYITYQLVCGMKYLHSMEIMHRDLKPSNITINISTSQQVIVKIIDMGLARTFVHDSNASMTSGCMTLQYSAPELSINPKIYDKKVDIWSIGCVLGFMLKQRHIFYAEGDVKGYIKKVARCLGKPTTLLFQQPSTQNMVPWLEYELSMIAGGNPEVFVEDLTQDFTDTSDTKVSDAKDVLLKMFKYSSNDRISIDELLQHGFLNSWTTGVGCEVVPPKDLRDKVIKFNEQFEKDKKTASVQQLKKDIFDDIRRSWPKSPNTNLLYNYQQPYPVTVLSVIRVFTVLAVPIAYFSLPQSDSLLYRVGLTGGTLCAIAAGLSYLRTMFSK